jgi:hypothetical protein
MLLIGGWGTTVSSRDSQCVCEELYSAAIVGVLVLHNLTDSLVHGDIPLIHPFPHVFVFTFN